MVKIKKYNFLRSHYAYNRVILDRFRHWEKKREHLSQKGKRRIKKKKKKKKKRKKEKNIKKSSFGFVYFEHHKGRWPSYLNGSDGFTGLLVHLKVLN